MKVIIDTEDTEALGALAEAIAVRLAPLLATDSAYRGHTREEAEAIKTEADKADKVKAPAVRPKTSAADKTAAAAKPAPKAEDGPSKDNVHEALRTFQTKHGRDKTLVILHKYSETLTGLTEDKYQDVIQALSDADKSDFD